MSEAGTAAGMGGPPGIRVAIVEDRREIRVDGHNYKTAAVELGVSVNTRGPASPASARPRDPPASVSRRSP